MRIGLRELIDKMSIDQLNAMLEYIEKRLDVKCGKEMEKGEEKRSTITKVKRPKLIL